MRTTVGGLALCALALLTALRVTVWASDVTLWADAYASNPQKPRSALNYAEALIHRNAPGDIEHADALAMGAYESASHRTGWERQQGMAIALAHSGVVQLMRGDREQALALFDRSVSISPTTSSLCIQFHCRPDGDPIYGGAR